MSYGNGNGVLLQLLAISVCLAVIHAQNWYTYSAPNGEDFDATEYLSYEEQQQVIFAQLNNDKRIVGGVKIPITAAPYQIALNFNGTAYCGGAILNKRWILTAAHCVSTGPGHYVVRAGSNSFKRGGQVRNVSKIIVNPRYQSKIYNHDLALMKLDRALNMGRKVQAINLPLTNAVPSKLLVAGWGTVSATAQKPQLRLRAALVDYIPQSTCQQYYGKRNVPITKNMLCAAAPGRDHCYGDSGGPLVHQGVTYGIVSFAYGCANPKFPGVYTRVSQFVNWILRVVKNH